ncbi:hypothetical protein HYH03_015254 [Edaphochlamys debaryana]|uniref:Uncharacterized protein n=1 Tax=Edaphochlamys debaryana TaxID=47281 RepID=A0A835XJS9_9CHLO|nr:hypothetical protein HYH03_015254 [Edaphochlamys debaryana]|eukprot:KAG2486047.1 hypothetical protein HYH03_015254 [Edaphochlamys debaryana]
MEPAPGGSPPGAGGAIKPINRASIHRICSGQVILDLATAVKELVENALDAGATNIEVRMREYGSAMVEVADNGRGVPPADYQALTLKYHTSKIASFDDLSSVSTYGFRGEALSSLCAVSDLSVVTRTAEQEAGVRLEYDREGHLTSRAPAPRAVGTTVGFKDLFSSLPVRHKEFLRNVKREFAKAVAVLQAYALVATHARIIVTHQAGQGGARSNVLATSAPAAAYAAYLAAAEPGPAAAGPGAAAADGSFEEGGASAADAPPPAQPSGPLPGSLGAVTASPAGSRATPRQAALLAALRDNLVSVFGGRVAEALEPLVLPRDEESGAEVVGWVSRAGCGLRGDASRQLFFLNGRPVDLPKAARIVNDCFKSLSSPAHAASSRAMAVLAVGIASEEVDVNVTPDKRRVFMAAEERLCARLQEALQALWEPSRCTYAVNQPTAAGGMGTGAGGGGGGGTAGGGSLLVAASGQRGRGGGAQQQRQTQLNVRRGGGGVAAAAAAQALDGFAAGPSQPPPPPRVKAEAVEEAEAPGPGPLRVGASDTGEGDGSGEEEAAAGGAASPPPAKRPRLSAGGGGSEAEAEAEAEAGVGSQGQGRGQGSQEQEGQDTGVGTQGSPVAAAVEPSPRGSQPPSGPGGGGGGMPSQPHSSQRKRASESAAAAAAGGRVSSGGGGAGSAVPYRHPFLSMMAGFGAGGTGRAAAAAGDAGAAAGAVDGSSAGDEEAEGQGEGSEDREAGARGHEGEMEAHQQQQHKRQQQQQQQEEVAEEEAVEGAGRGRAAKRARRAAARAAAEEATAAEEQEEEGGAAAQAAGELKPGGGRQGRREAAAAAAAVEAEAARDAGPGSGGAGSGGSDTLEPDTAMEEAEDGTTAPKEAGQEGAQEEEEEEEEVDRAPLPTPATPTGPPTTPVTTLRLRPGQLAEATAARIRHLRAQQRRRQAQEQQQAAAEGGPGRYAVSSLQEGAEEGPGGGDGSAGAAAPGGAGGGSGLGSRAEREAAAERELERVFAKEHFREMKVLGQFNLGFILASHRRDVFIVDQHAAAEKTTFERLQRTVVLARQPLLAPMSLGLLPVDQLLIREHLPVFRRNGFDFVERGPDGRVRPLPGPSSAAKAAAAAAPAPADAADAAACEDRGAEAAGNGDGQRQGGEGGGEDAWAWAGGGEGGGGGGGGGGELLLSSVPVSRATGQLGAEDVAELVAMLREGGGPAAGAGGEAGRRAWEEELRPSRIRAMLASRACRSSVMIGKALSRAEMRRLLVGLADLRQPWNCPHGRPTMRHVCVLPERPGLAPEGALALCAALAIALSCTLGDARVLKQAVPQPCPPGLVLVGTSCIAPGEFACLPSSASTAESSTPQPSASSSAESSTPKPRAAQPAPAAAATSLHRLSGTITYNGQLTSGATALTVCTAFKSNFEAVLESLGVAVTTPLAFDAVPWHDPGSEYGECDVDGYFARADVDTLNDYLQSTEGGFSDVALPLYSDPGISCSGHHPTLIFYMTYDSTGYVDGRFDSNACPARPAAPSPPYMPLQP